MDLLVVSSLAHLTLVLPGFVSELRDDVGFGRLWGILSRSPTLAAVQDLVVSEVQQRKFLFVLHSDGILRVWDLFSRCKIFSHAMTAPIMTGAFVRLWVGDVNNNAVIIPFAMLHKQNSEVSTETNFLYGLRCNVGDRIPLTLEPSLKNISSGDGGTIDVRFASNKVWILKEDGLIMQDLFHNDIKEGLAHYYALQETFVADLLFQSSEHSSDDLLWLAYSAFSSSKGGNDSPVSILQCWKTFCTCYMNNWCKNNAACGLLMDPFTGAIGLVRNNMLSVCRGLEDVEHIISGSVDEQNNPGFSFSGDELDQKILFELLQCVRNVNQQL